MSMPTAVPTESVGGLDDVVIITGKGEGVLISATRRFLLDVGGPRVTDDPENAGRFVLKRADILEWANGNDNDNQ